MTIPQIVSPVHGLIDPSALLTSIYASAIDFGIITLDSERVITSWNAGAERIIGFSAKEVVGALGDSIFTPEDLSLAAPEIEAATSLAMGRAADNRWHMRKDGSRFWADGVMTPLFDEAKQHIGFVKILRDITEQKLTENRMHQLANFDPLTGLLNRFAFEQRLQEMMAISVRSHQLLIMQALDLDRFKDINDTLGHHSGDILLQAVASRMREVVRDADLVARLGGDEFVILQPNMSSPQAGAELAQKLIEAISRPFHIDGHEVLIGCSIGLAICPDDTEIPQQLLQKADLALYRAKKDIRGSYHYFTAGMDAAAHERSHHLTALRKAVKRQEFWLEYQPKIDSQSGQAIAVEALLRFSNPVLSALPLETVITLATESGLMPEISMWVLREGCAQARKWKNEGIDLLHICINVCSRELMDSKTPEKIDCILAETGMAWSDLELEITERQALDIDEQGIELLREIHERGILIALDDFGTGYSALSYLKTLPISTVKLDKTFLRDIPQDPESCTIAKALISLVHALKLEVIAEGVESAEQADFLCRNDCNVLQGYFYTRPLPPEPLTRWLLERQSAYSPT
ncbi:MAG TPA: EAL domain-containing protein [Methylophilaceae bacterium]|nr:EAL domain-containing protein [Methylophilaceae bacterium]